MFELRWGNIFRFWIYELHELFFRDLSNDHWIYGMYKLSIGFIFSYSGSIIVVELLVLLCRSVFRGGVFKLYFLRGRSLPVDKWSIGLRFMPGWSLFNGGGVVFIY